MDDDDDEDEVILVVELSGLPSVDMIKACNESCLVLGLESPQPVIQLDNYFFQGTYEDTVGTSLVFKEEEESKSLQYLCKTDKKLVMKRVILKEKQTSLTMEPEPNPSGTMETEPSPLGTMETEPIPPPTEDPVVGSHGNKVT